MTGGVGSRWRRGRRAARGLALAPAALACLAIGFAFNAPGAAAPPPRGATALPASPAPPRPGSPEGLWQAARQAVPADSATTRYGELARRYPRHPLAQAALMELGDCQYARGEYQAARQYYRRVRGPAAGRARFGEALCAYALGDPTQARRIAQPLVRERNDPATWLAALLVAQSWEAEGRVPETLTAYRRLLDLPAGPAEPAALLGAARAAERAGQAEASAQHLADLLHRYPNSAESAEARSLARRSPAAAGAAPGSQGEPAPQGKK